MLSFYAVHHLSRGGRALKMDRFGKQVLVAEDMNQYAYAAGIAACPFLQD
jgi:hypothetical protein